MRRIVALGEWREDWLCLECDDSSALALFSTILKAKLGIQDTIFYEVRFSLFKVRLLAVLLFVVSSRQCVEDELGHQADAQALSREKRREQRERSCFV